MNDTQHKVISDNVLAAIKKGTVLMRPRWHFVLRGLLFGLGTALLFLLLMFISSFTIFNLHQTGAWFVPAFGFRGIREFLFALPWLLIVIAILFIIVLEILVRHYSFGYRRPLLYSALGVIVLVIAGGVIISLTPLHSRFLRYAEENRLPFAGQFYRDFGHRRFETFHRGTIEQKNAGGFVILDREGNSVQIIVTSETRFPFGSDFNIGDNVVVFGEGSSTINALGIRETGEPSEPPHLPPRNLRPITK